MANKLHIWVFFDVARDSCTVHLFTVAYKAMSSDAWIVKLLSVRLLAGRLLRAMRTNYVVSAS